MRSLGFIAACAVAVACGAALSLAQERQEGRSRGPGGGNFFGGGGGMFVSRMSLLQINEVRKELDLVDEQVAAIEKIEDELRAKYPMPFGGRGPGGRPGGGGSGGGGSGGEGQRDRLGPGSDRQGAVVAPVAWYFVAQNQEQPRREQSEQGGRRFGGGPPSDEDRARFEQQRVERAREERTKLAEVLLPDQMKRLTEIYIQVVGASALQDEEVAKEVGISDAQKSQLTKIREEFGTKRRELGGRGGGGGGGGGDFEAIRARIIELTRAQDEQTLAVLSAQQKSKFEEMKGKPFAMPEFPRGGPGGPGGNRTRRGDN